MPDLCVTYSVGASLKMNEANQDTLVPLSIKGLHGRPIRATIIPRGATDGGRKLTPRFGPRIIVVTARAQIVAQPGVSDEALDAFSDMTTYLTRLNTLLDAWTTGLEALVDTPFTLSYTPTGLATVNRTVTYGHEGGEFEMTSEGENAMIAPTVTYSLVQETG